MTETDMKKTKKLELLAPAGTLDICKAVVNAGADAVYLGGQMFGARAFAGNLNGDEISEALDHAHLHGAKIYLTLNTLLEEKELKKAYEYLRPIYMSGIDAVIVQDYGVLKMIRESFPDLPVHASTQMTVSEKTFASYLKSYGVKRVVLPREFTLEEARAFKDTGLELEAFVHGALCYCYSGQCMLSAAGGKRSGNRGTCAQPCRLEYEVRGKKGRYLSAKDIAALELIPEIASSGICSLKIEGRMKNVNYAAGAPSVYRKYVDLFESGEEYRVDPGDINDLLDLYNRGGFSKGFFGQEKGKDFIAFKRPNHQGTEGLKVIKNIKGRILFEALEDINKGDVFETAPGSSFTSGKDLKKGERLEVNLPVGLGLKENRIIYRVNNAALQKSIQERFADKQKPVSVNMKAVLRADSEADLEITLADSGVSVSVSGERVQKAKTKGVTAEDIEMRLSKLGDTGFVINEISIDSDEDIFISNGGLNRLRRDALEALTEEVRKKYSQGRKCFDYKQNNDIMGGSMFNTPGLNVSVCSIEQLSALPNTDRVNRIYVSYLIFEEAKKKGLISELKDSGRQIYISLPYVLTQENTDIFEELICGFSEDDADGLEARSLEEVMFIGKAKASGLYRGPLNTVTDSGVYCCNRKAVDFTERAVKDSGLMFEAFTLPTEPDTESIRDIAPYRKSELIIYGRNVVMRSKHCIRKNISGCDRSFGREELFFGKKAYPVMCFCDHCNNIILDSTPLDLRGDKETLLKAGADTLRLDFTVETYEETVKILKNTFV